MSGIEQRNLASVAKLLELPGAGGFPGGLGASAARTGRLMLLACCLAIAVVPAAIAQSDAPDVSANEKPALRIDFRTGKAFQETLEAPISARWSNASLRMILSRIAEDRQISVLLDRRVDPTRELSFAAANDSTLTLLDSLVADVPGKARVTSSTVYLGPDRAADRLRTLVALRSNELFDDSRGVPERRRFELTRRASFHWDDLTPPADLLGRIGQEFKLRIDGIERVPHDLWAGATLPQVGVVDALLLVLVQFDLAFEWQDRAAAIAIVPIPERVVITRKHAPPRGTTAASAAVAWRSQFPGVEATAIKAEVQVTGTLEEHEAIERLQRPVVASAGGTPGSPKKATSDADPLSAKRFTIRIVKIPVRSLMQTLARSPDAKLQFEYDEDVLKAAGIDLDQRVTFNVSNATAGQLLQEIFTPVGVAVELDGRSVTLKPAEKPRDN